VTSIKCALLLFIPLAIGASQVDAQAPMMKVSETGFGAEYLSVSSADLTLRGFSVGLARSGSIEAEVTYLGEGDYSSVAVGITGYPVRQGRRGSVADFGLSLAIGQAGDNSPGGEQATFFSLGMMTFSRLQLGRSLRFVPGVGAGLTIAPKLSPSFVAGVIPQVGLALDLGQTVTLGVDYGVQIDTEETLRVFGIGLVARVGESRAPEKR